MDAGAEFLADWAELERIGVDARGVERQAASVADGEQRRWFATLLESRGYTVLCDRIGNQFGLLEPVPGAPFLLCGSHLDSQPTAGRFDGAYGVLAALHACTRATTAARTRPAAIERNLAVVNWFNEEGSRFKPALMGSGVFTGKLTLDAALATTDRDGVSVAQALDAIAARGDAPVFGEGSGRSVCCYAEIHVQQGPSMERDGQTIGLVCATWAAHKLELRVTGAQAHTGATPMDDRRDALLGAARIVVAAGELSGQFAPGLLHTGCGELTIYPNSPVTVASEVGLLVDLRSPDANVIRQAHRSLMSTIEQIERAVRVEVSVVSEHRWDQNPYTAAGVALAGAVADELGLASGQVMTVAGHDSTNLKDLVPTIMLFVPSVAGISHHRDEFTRTDDLLAGVDQLTGVVARLLAGELG